MNKKFVLLFVFVFMSIFYAILVFGAHTILTSGGGTTFSVNEDVGFIYNITVNNTDATDDTNITQVNITIPNTFSFIADSNGTDAGTHTFANTSTVLSWDNNGLVMNLTWKYFWFNATTSTPGYYNLSIITLNVTGVSQSNISVIINDTTAPYWMAFSAPSAISLNLSRNTSIIYNVSVNDSYSNIDKIRFYLYNSSWGLVNNSNVSAVTSSANSSGFINYTMQLANGVYYVNVTANDSAGNQNTTGISGTLLIDTINPIITLISPDNATSSTTSAYNFTFNVTDTNFVSNCSLILDGSAIHLLNSINNTGGTNGMYNSSLSVATHTWNVNCSDSAGNVGNSSIRTLIVSAAAATTSPDSSSSGSSTSLPEWYAVLASTSSQFTAGYTKILGMKHAISFKVGNETHYVGVINLTASNVTIKVTSTPQVAVLNVGSTKSFDVNSDKIYDVKVTINKIENNKASVSVIFTNEPVIQVTTPVSSNSNLTNQENNAGGETAESTADVQGIDKSTILWISLVVLIVVIAVIVVLLIKSKSNKRHSWERMFKIK